MLLHSRTLCLVALISLILLFHPLQDVFGEENLCRAVVYNPDTCSVSAASWSAPELQDYKCVDGAYSMSSRWEGWGFRLTVGLLLLGLNISSALPSLILFPSLTKVTILLVFA